MQGTTDLHHQSADALLPETDAVFDTATPLDPAVDRLDPQPPLGARLLGPFLLPGQLLAARFLGGPEDLPPSECERQEAQSLSQPAPGG
jgi:hypothetical protein